MEKHGLVLISAPRKLSEPIEWALAGRTVPAPVPSYLPPTTEPFAKLSEFGQLLGCEDLPQLQFSAEPQFGDLGLRPLEFL